MKINIGDIYREQTAKYNFASKFASGNILDITFGKYLDFTKSELLLSKGAKEVWSFDLFNNDQYLTIRKLDNEGKISFQTKDMKELEYTKFNCIFSFNALSITDNIDRILEIIQKCLSPNGTVVISILNNEIFSNQNNNSRSTKLKCFTKNNFEKNLTTLFNDVSFFSQGYISLIKKYQESVSHIEKSHVTLKSLIRNKLRNFFLKTEQRRIFYQNYISPKYYYIKKIRRNRKYKIDPKKYNIVPYDEGKKVTSIIALCKK